MNQEMMKEILIKKYFNNSYPYKILISGDWGIGKTFIFNMLEKHNKSIDTGKLKIIYTSLFGIDSIDKVELDIKYKYLAFIKSQKIKLMNNITNKLNDIIKGLSEKITGYQFDLFSYFPLDLDNEYLICLDDIERKDKKLDDIEILGLIDRKLSKAKIIFLLNQEKNTNCSTLNTYHEKIFDRKYILNEISEITIDSCLSMNNIENINEHIDVIKKNFLLYGKKNLRLLFQIINFIKEFKNEITLNENLVKLASIVLIEDASGNEVLKKSVNEGLRSAYLSINKENFFSKYNINYNDYDTVNKIIDYFKTCNIDYSFFKNYINPQKSEFELLLSSIQNTILNTEYKLIENLNRIWETINDLDYSFFSSYLELVKLITWTDSIIEYYNVSNYNIEDLFSNSFKIIDYFLPETNTQDLLPNIKFQITYPDNISDKTKSFVKDVESKILKFKLKNILESFKESFNSKNYTDCLTIIANNPEILPHVLFIFDKLKSESLEENYYRVVIEIIKHFGPESQEMRNYFKNEFKIKNDDDVIEKRFEIIKEILDK
jgi:hypothetical protein